LSDAVTARPVGSSPVLVTTMSNGTESPVRNGPPRTFLVMVRPGAGRRRWRRRPPSPAAWSDPGR
jgi:hypothetical protein